MQEVEAAVGKNVYSRRQRPHKMIEGESLTKKVVIRWSNG